MAVVELWGMSGSSNFWKLLTCRIVSNPHLLWALGCLQVRRDTCLLACATWYFEVGQEIALPVSFQGRGEPSHLIYQTGSWGLC